MASLQEPCLVRLYRQRPNGNKTLIVQQRVEQLAPAGGAPDGAPASVSTPEKLLTVNSGEVFEINDLLMVSVELDSADGLDKDDSIWSIPLLTAQGPKTLGRAQFANPAFADTAANLPAATEIFIAGYRIIETGARIAGKIYLDIQDDTA